MKDVVEINALMGEAQDGFRRDRRGEDYRYAMIERLKKI